MSRLKRSIVHAGLIALTVWPAAHIGLAKTWGVNPWKLAGWGMYAAPQIPPEMRISCVTPDEVGVYPLRTLSPALEAARHEFLRSRLGLGGLARPGAFGQTLLDHMPSIDGVTIEVIEPVLSRRTGRIEERRTTYAYWREGKRPGAD